MCPKSTPSPTEGNLREELAAYFLATPPLAELSGSKRQDYLRQLHRLGELERQDICRNVGTARPLVWGNPAPLIQALLSAAQRLAARLGQPILIFPARETAIGTETLLHPRLLSIALCDLLYRGCAAAPRQPLWVRLQEQKSGLAVAVTATQPFMTDDTLTLIKECTKLHGGSLVHCDETVVFSCGQVSDPPTGVRLYGCPTEEDLLADTLSPIWSIFYAGCYSSLDSSNPATKSSGEISAASHSTGSSSSATFTEGADRL